MTVLFIPDRPEKPFNYDSHDGLNSSGTHSIHKEVEEKSNMKEALDILQKKVLELTSKVHQLGSSKKLSKPCHKK